ncbi:MAG: nucleotide exchange factor GrpE [Ectothiorhodospiraceae bacterium AqS1]|nr:nucleotide exchange factor GrpE [Ectothiorhodospiraceae bacterium AqS1]
MMASEEKSTRESEVNASAGGVDEPVSPAPYAEKVVGQEGEAGSSGGEVSAGDESGERESYVDGSGSDAVADGTGLDGAAEGVVEAEPELEPESEPEVVGADEVVEILPSAAELAEAKDQAERYRDQALRAQAELENVRKRTARDIENAHKYALEGFIKSILPVRDSLELGLVAAQQQRSGSGGESGGSDGTPVSVQGDGAAAVEGDAASEQSSAVDAGASASQSGESGTGSAGDSGIDKVVEGMTLTLEMLDGVMGKHGIEIIDPKDEPFNPEVHQAISEVPSEGVASKTVVDVFQKGCLLNGRVIRAAMVVIAK